MPDLVNQDRPIGSEVGRRSAGCGAGRFAPDEYDVDSTAVRADDPNCGEPHDWAGAASATSGPVDYRHNDRALIGQRMIVPGAAGIAVVA